MEIKEVWKDCKGYEGLYQVSNLDRMWSVKGQRYFTGSVNNRGYCVTTLIAKNGKRKTEMIDTEKSTDTSETRYKCSFNLMQKELTGAQKTAVEGANS